MNNIFGRNNAWLKLVYVNFRIPYNCCVAYSCRNTSKQASHKQEDLYQIHFYWLLYFFYYWWNILYLIIIVKGNLEITVPNGFLFIAVKERFGNRRTILKGLLVSSHIVILIMGIKHIHFIWTKWLIYIITQWLLKEIQHFALSCIL